MYQEGMQGHPFRVALLRFTQYNSKYDTLTTKANISGENLPHFVAQW